jgi:programmed cell death 6-interacting protein
MLAIPAVKSLSNLDTSSMASCLVRQSGCQEDLVNSDIASLMQQRSSATNVTDASEYGQKALLQYCQQLRQFVPRFAGLEPQLKLNFSWNLASFESLMGGRLDRTSEDGLRAASKHFQQAAGYVEFIIQSVLASLPQLANFPCMSIDGLKMVRDLMLAQAQLCFYEKAVKDKKAGNMKAAIIAKLAKQTSIFYGGTSVACKVGALGSMLDISWFAVTDFQCKLFDGAAEYWQAQASKDAALATGSGYGEEVARYNRADTHVGIALSQMSKFPIPDSLTYGANGLRQAIVTHRAAALKDLQTVYMEAAPADHTLAEITGVAMVRVAAVAELGASASPKIFSYVLPQAIRDANLRYGEEVTALLMATTNAAEGGTNAGRNALSAKGLPGSLEAAKAEVSLPPSLWAKVQ